MINYFTFCGIEIDVSNCHQIRDKLNATATQPRVHWICPLHPDHSTAYNGTVSNE